MHSITMLNTNFMHKLFRNLLRFRTMDVKSSSITSASVQKSVIAVCQLTATNDKEHNFQICKSLINEAKAADAKVVFLPEACDFIGTSRQETLNLAETLDGPLVQKYRQVARDLKIWLSLGGLHERASSEKLYNTHLMIDEEGNIVGKYHKTHLFDVEIPDQNIRLLESSYVEKGEKITPPQETPVGKIGLSICYDMRFPELSLVLRKMGAEILTYPSAFTFATGASHWEALLRARAIETQCYVVAAAQTGTHNPKRISWGHAMVVDPWGKVIAQCSEGQGIATTTINHDYIKKVRENMPVGNHRRIDLYPVMKPKELQFSSKHEVDFYHFGQVKVSKESVFFKTDLTIAFTNKRCVVPGHVLISSIRIAKRMVDLTPDEVADLFQVTQKIAVIMEAMHGASSTTIVVQDGPEAGQTIEHVHVHILPRKQGDFSRNDDIYEELQKHDKDESKPWRSEEEMCAEAEEIRKMILSE